jgi:hypothetical protein
MSPLDEYRRRQAEWSARQEAAQRSFIAIGNWRLLTAIAGFVLAWFVFARHAITIWSLLAPLGMFVGLVIWHQRVLRRRNFAERAIHFYQQAMNRIQDTWAGTGNQGEQFRDPKHIYADDLDLFGKGSLFEFLSSARTAAGEHTLANWLLAPSECQEAIERQAALRELAPKLDLREEMALLGEDIKSAINADVLAAWGSAPPVEFPSALRMAAIVLSLAGLFALILKLAEVWPLWPLLAILGINAVLIFVFRRETTQVEASSESAAHQLSLLSLLVERLERESFSSTRLQHLRQTLATQGIPASKCIRQLDRRLELLDSSDHVVLRVVGPLLLYKQQIVMSMEDWRAKNGAAIGKWINALAEFEALSSLGALHYERPTWCFPTLSESDEAYFIANELGHPLIATDTSVRNSLNLNSECRLLIVSGSNMSGKSTLLRAVGLNTILAWAGAPVCAAELKLSPLQVGASLRVSDSLQDNRSRFFAEISRLRQIVDLTQGSIPVLFLLDELLSGTNSHDRLIGATGIVRGLLAAHTIGLLTTHDLALAHLDQEPGFAAKNVHLEDRIVDGKIEFDYHLRPGVVTHSNALELMRSIGLDI